MGKMAIILTMGLAVIIGFFVLRLNSNARQGLDTTLNMYQYTQARLIANSGVEIYLEKMRKDKNLNSGTITNQKLLDGTYDITITPGTNDSITIRSMGHFMGVSNLTIVKAVREPAPFPIAPAALYLSTAALAIGTSGIKGNITVSGFDHNVDPAKGGKYPPIDTSQHAPNIVPGILVDNASDISKIGSVLGGSNQIDGLGIPSILADNQNVDWEAMSNEIAFSADRTLESDSISNKETFGTRDKPQITLLNGNVKLLGGMSGAGILVINGDLTIRANFEFEGIIIAYKNSEINLELNGGATLLGSLIVSGSTINMDVSAGGFKALYCKQALDNAKLNLKSSRFKILSWWE